MAEFKDRLKKLRIQKGLTQKELGKLSGTAETTIRQYENNKRQPIYSIVIALAQFFQVSTDYLLGLSDERVNHKLSEVSTEELLLELLRRERKD